MRSIMLLMMNPKHLGVDTIGCVGVFVRVAKKKSHLNKSHKLCSLKCDHEMRMVRMSRANAMVI